MKQLINKIGAGLSVLPVLLLPTAAFAQLSDATTNLGEVGTALGSEATGTTLPELIGNLINVFLSVLGIVFILMVVYAGWIYMSASGDDEKTKKAKKLLAQAVIGIIIIVAAYAISAFVIDSISGAVG